MIYLVQELPTYRKQHFHLRAKIVFYNTRLSGNEGQCFLYKGPKLIVFHVSKMLEYIHIRHKTK